MHKPSKLISLAFVLGLAASGSFPDTALAISPTLAMILQPGGGPFSNLPWVPPAAEKTPVPPRDLPREQPREQPKEEPREQPKDQPKDQPTDLPKEKDQPNLPGELPQQWPNDRSREQPWDIPKGDLQPVPQPKPGPHPLPRPEPAPQSHDRPWIDSRVDYPL